MESYSDESSAEVTENVSGESTQETGFALEAPEVQKGKVAKLIGRAGRSTGARANQDEAKQVLSYRYDDKRKNNPHVGMVTSGNDCAEEKSTWV